MVQSLIHHFNNGDYRMTADAAVQFAQAYQELERAKDRKRKAEDELIVARKAFQEALTALNPPSE